MTVRTWTVLPAARSVTWTQADFHQKGTDCPSASGGIEDYNNLREVESCELVGLAHLRTENIGVRNTLAPPTSTS